MPAQATKDPWQGAGELWLIAARAQATHYGVTFARPGTLATHVQLGQQHHVGDAAAADRGAGTVAITTAGGAREGATNTSKDKSLPILSRVLVVATVRGQYEFLVTLNATHSLIAGPCGWLKRNATLLKSCYRYSDES